MSVNVGKHRGSAASIEILMRLKAAAIFTTGESTNRVAAASLFLTKGHCKTRDEERGIVGGEVRKSRIGLREIDDSTRPRISMRPSAVARLSQHGDMR